MLSDMVRYIGPRSRGGHFNTSVLRRRAFWLDECRYGLGETRAAQRDIRLCKSVAANPICHAFWGGHHVRTQPFTLFIFAASLQPCSRNDPKIVLQEEFELTLSI